MTAEMPLSTTTDDTRAILALCSRGGKRADVRAAPLTASEYHGLTVSMRDTGIRPAALFTLGEQAIVDLVRRMPERERAKVEPLRIRRLLDRGALIALRISELSSRAIWVIGRGDPQYPSRYRTRLGSSAPPLLYGCGPTQLLERGGLAVVGSREPDPQSAANAQEAGKLAAQRSVPVVSGAARGVDELSMLAAVDAGGEAVGALAESLFRLSVRADYRTAIRDRRAVLMTPYEPDAGFSVSSAMGRNRLIHALADTSLVVAASEGRGGTWAARWRPCATSARSTLLSVTPPVPATRHSWPMAPAACVAFLRSSSPIRSSTPNMVQRR